MSSHKKRIEEEKLAGSREVLKHLKNKVNNQMDDFFSDSSPKATIFKKKDCVDFLSRKISIAFTLVVAGNHAESCDAKPLASKVIICSRKIL